MKSEYYKITNRKIEGWRQLGENETLLPGDIMLSNKSKLTMFHTSTPYKLFTGVRSSLWLSSCFDNKVLTKFTPGGMVEHLIKTFPPFEGMKYLTRTYSLWRKKTILPRNPYQDKPLPLP